ncbi:MULTISPECIES: hypothetical protein [unclassified Paraburkholderia]|uniref:hypothetical protein n=1 Tax=unclassified Paraburkholderia TaxID=2615204 RepID=UPI0020B84050|nr:MULTISPECIES: hypothetical protein [unclassified Paraburkholderia]MCP3717825.1 hypothetical protein [Paraburkholderia sp. CNPSo 3281]MCX5539559.1 hypothetical protein [Paraburkholderia sp. CNPSo 3076]
MNGDFTICVLIVFIAAMPAAGGVRANDAMSPRDARRLLTLFKRTLSTDLSILGA